MRGPVTIAWDPSRNRSGRVVATLLLAAVSVVSLAPTAGAGKQLPPPPLPAQHRHLSGGFAFRTPEGWKVDSPPENPEVVNAAGDGVAVRFVYRDGENGYDSLHGVCMLERLADAMDMDPVVRYEYDFVGGVIGDRRALDSAFVVTYDKPILGQRQWRQRNVTIVGNGSSLCAITYAPLPLWKKSAPTRALLDAVLASVTFR
ncbi:MAG TPA: hypothetical protein VFT38_08240 [Vicinamibacteria bacterium]|nr:hypothetical protein [Vicinamibacteria bacterium]